jgi:hypothetical protein
MTLFCVTVEVPLVYIKLLFDQRGILRSPAARDREAANGYPTIGHLLFLVAAYKPEVLFLLVAFKNSNHFLHQLTV